MKELLNNTIRRQQADRVRTLEESKVPREIGIVFKESLRKKLIKAVIVPRRSGKSSIVHQVLSKSGEQ